MLRIVTVSVLFVSLAMILAAPQLRAQQDDEPRPTPKFVPPAPAPVPEQIIAGKKAFIANAGQDISPFEPKYYSGGPERSYDEFYALMKGWGRYDLVSAPSDADLVLQIHLSFSAVAQPYDPQFRLTILDPKTHVVLWVFTEHIETAGRLNNRDKNFELAMAKLVDDVKRLQKSN